MAGLYGYLAKQFTVFGQHVHIGCENGTQALWLLHRLSVYIPQVLATLEQVRPLARELGSLAAMDEIERWVRSEGNDARWQRETYQSHHSMAELVLRSAERFRGTRGVTAAPPREARAVGAL